MSNITSSSSSSSPATKDGLSTKPPVHAAGKVEIHQETATIIKARLIQHVMQTYYFLNFTFLLVYPVLRLSGLISKPSNELMILYVSGFMVVIKILKNKNVDQILTGIIFTLKMSTLILLYYSGETQFKLEYTKKMMKLKTETSSSTESFEESEPFKFDNEKENIKQQNTPISTKDLGYLANFFHYGFYYVMVYLFVCMLVYLYKSQPEPKQSSFVHFFNQISLKNSLSFSVQSKELKDKYLLVEFFTTWSPPCTYLASTFSDLSYVYQGINFGKIDIGRWKSIAYEYDINDSVSSKQIPSIILFKNGLEVSRMPYRKNEFKIPYDKKTPKDDKLFEPCNLSYDNIKLYFNLDRILAEVKPSLNNENSDKKNNNKNTNKNSKKNR
ncbi:hypothetical protein RB653_000308 [Dictyostelium firmibasis]|uniref:Thioredoxin domain-containing protein n=1 Tax=Dictyostelium firmibasis TaxID=79012 RepID=A0AAN7TWG0_9MYCE